MSEQTSTQARLTTSEWRFPPGVLLVVAARWMPRLLIPQVAVLVFLALASLLSAIMFPEQVAEMALRF